MKIEYKLKDIISTEMKLLISEQKTRIKNLEDELSENSCNSAELKKWQTAYCELNELYVKTKNELNELKGAQNEEQRLTENN